MLLSFVRVLLSDVCLLLAVVDGLWALLQLQVVCLLLAVVGDEFGCS